MSKVEKRTWPYFDPALTATLNYFCPFHLSCSNPDDPQFSYTEEGVEAARKEAIMMWRQHIEIEKEYRRYMWLHHGHDGLYGDDGEMQCGHCMLDFKRAPLLVIREKLMMLALRQAAAMANGFDKIIQRAVDNLKPESDGERVTMFNIVELACIEAMKLNN